MHPGYDFDARDLAQELSRDGAAGHSTDGLPSAGASPAMPSANAVFGLGGVVGMGGPVEILHLGVGGGPGVLVADEQGNGRAEGAALEEARDDLGPVGFLARGGEPALAGSTTVEFALDFGDVEGEPGRASVHHDAHRSAVGFAEGSDPEDFSEAAAHFGPLG